MSIGHAPFFSVVIPTHDHVQFIGGALQCVLDQTFQDFEIVVVDNGSTDGTREVVDGFDDPRITYHWQEDSGLPANSRNVGIGLASGEYIAFLDSDDSWRPSKLERVAVVLRESDADIVCHGAEIVLDGRSVGSRSYRFESDDVYSELLYRGNLLTTSATTVRRAVLLEAGLFSEDRGLLTVEDFDLWLRLASAGYRFELLDEVLGEYLIHKGNTSADLERTYRNMFTVLESHYLPLAHEGRLDVRRALLRRSRARLAMIRDMVRSGHLPGAMRRLGVLPAELMTKKRTYREAAGHRA